MDGSTVLTAEHVVCENGDLAESIWVVPNRVPEARDELDQYRADMTWYSSSKESSRGLDVALLKMREALQIDRFWSFVERASGGSNVDHFEAYGFAIDAEKFKTDRGRTCIGGSLRIADRKDDEFSVHSTDEPPTDDWGEPGWWGMSGAPVIVRSHEIWGVIRQSELMADRLSAIPMWRILQAEGFAEAAGLTGAATYQASGRQKLIEETAAILANDAALAAAIKSWDERFAAAHNESAAAMVECVVEIGEVEDLMFRFLAFKKAQRPSGLSFENLKAVAFNIACLMYHHRACTSHAIRLHRGLWVLSTKNENVAQLIVSGQVGRRGGFEATGRGFPRPEFSIPMSTLEAGARPDSWAHDQLGIIETRMILNDFARALLPSEHSSRFAIPIGKDAAVTAMDRKVAAALVPTLRMALRIHNLDDNKQPWHLALWAKDDAEISVLDLFIQKLTRYFPNDLEFRVLDRGDDAVLHDAMKVEEEAPLLALWELAEFVMHDDKTPRG